jgi:hypothetical protein
MVDPYLIEGCYIELSNKTRTSKLVDKFYSKDKNHLKCLSYNYRVDDHTYKVIGTPWDFAPDWAEWVATDENSQLWFYNTEPLIVDDRWCDSLKTNDDCCQCGFDYTCKDWKKSKRKRPVWAKRNYEK